MRSDAKLKSKTVTATSSGTGVALSSRDANRDGTRDATREPPSPRPLKLKTYQAWTMSEALAFVKKDLGDDAVVLHTRTFERGGFFGFGRKSVVEITAARANDMPQTEPKRVESRQAEPQSGIALPVGSRAAAARFVPASAVGAKSADGAGEHVQFSAAARAYASAGASAGSSPRSLPPFGSATSADARGAAAADASDRARQTNLSANLGANLDMNVEREKTRRLAQAMAIQLEKQTNERANAERNERATGIAARDQQRGGVGPASGSAATSTPPIATVVTTEPARPAQRFVLVPEARTANGGSGFTAVCTPTTAAQPVVPASAAVVPPAAALASPAAALASPAAALASPAAALASPAAQAASTQLHAELDTISAFVGRVLAARGGSPEPNARAAMHVDVPAITTMPKASRPEALEQAYARLIEQEVARDLADRILADVERELVSAADAGQAPTESAVRRAIERRLAALLPDDGLDPFRILPGRNGHARRIAFVGPTGVGKTTTLAKFAAQLSLKRGLRVGIVAADTYRIAAVDQLRTYAEILNLPVAVANSPADAQRACESLGEVDVILIDTAGRSQNDRMKLAELRAFLAAAAPDETHLVLSATASARTLSREADSFGALGIDRLVLTKLDEAASFGTLVSLVERLGKRVSFFTNGQEVPDHMEVARGRRLATLVMGDAVGGPDSAGIAHARDEESQVWSGAR